jgi:hypothetical protein
MVKSLEYPVLMIPGGDGRIVIKYDELFDSLEGFPWRAMDAKEKVHSRTAYTFEGSL